MAAAYTMAAENALISVWVRRGQKGGPGSGYHGHAGRPGRIGGSASRGGGAGGQGTTYHAGITSARPGKTREQVAKNMEVLHRDLSAVAKDVRLSMGTGGWEGGSEPTHICQFTNGAPALSVLAKYAKEHDQDAAIVMKGVSRNDPNAAPQQRLKFGRPLDEPAMRVVEKQLVSNGIGGWTWANDGGKTALVVQTIKQWGGSPEADLKAIQGLRDALNGLGANVRYGVSYTDVTVMERGGYDEFIKD